MTMELTQRETVYAEWLNILGSDPIKPSEGAQEVHVLHILAEDAARSVRLSKAYVKLLVSLAPQVRERNAPIQELVEAARDGYIQYVPTLPLMIDELDCSPENVRSLMKKAGQ